MTPLRSLVKCTVLCLYEIAVDHVSYQILGHAKIYELLYRAGTIW